MKFLNNFFSLHSRFIIEQKTAPGGDYKPDKPAFAWELYPTLNGLTGVRIKWLPDFSNNRPGDHFFVKVCHLF